MTDDASTAYICIYCPFNSDNLEALEHHLTSAHEYGCQDVLLPQSSSSSSPPANITSKASKREAPDDEQSPSSLDGIEQKTDYPCGVKRVKRTSSPVSSDLPMVDSHDHTASYDHDEDDDDVDDERDSSLDPTAMLSTNHLTCPTCSSTFFRLADLLQHLNRKHQIDLSNYEESEIFDILATQMKPGQTALAENDKRTSTASDKPKTVEVSPLTCETGSLSNAPLPATTDCPYCDFKSTDIEQFKSHIIAHIRDKNYRCLLCNRLYKYRGDCSFHIRRKHHRYSANFNDYIQRFVFDLTDGDESLSANTGKAGVTVNGSTNHSNSTREQDEPARYFGCPYCDYTSNYGGDVRKHQARKHPNAESKVTKILRQDSEQQQHLSFERHDYEDNDDDHEEEEEADDDEDVDDHGPQNMNLIKKLKKLKGAEKVDIQQQQQQQHASPLSVLSNFAPVRVFQCSSCHQQGTYKWVVERHIRAKHPDQADAHVIELPAELSAKLQKITSPLKRFRCSLCPLQSKHSWVVIRHIKHFHTLQTASVLDIQPDGTSANGESSAFSSGDALSKPFHHDSDSSSASSLGADHGMDAAFRTDAEEGAIRASTSMPPNDSMVFTYKCSLCEYQSTISWNTQKHINEKHAEQTNAFILTQCRQAPSFSTDQMHAKVNSSKKSKNKNGNGIHRSLSPASALAKAKFSPAIEEALLSLQGSKLNPNLYAVQPKFGIKRLKCRHCFYRSNWKTDMIRHVRIRHNLTEPDHHKDMIIMTEQEARATIESYENTFGKELRRRTFRTWNDWAKAEQEFTPKDGSLQYADNNGEQTYNDQVASTTKKIVRNTDPKLSSTLNLDEIKRSAKMSGKKELQPAIQQKLKAHVPSQSSIFVQDEFKPIPNPSNIVSRLLLTASPPSHSHPHDSPLDLSFKPSASVETIDYQSIASEEMISDVDRDEANDDDNSDHDEPATDESSTVNYLCSACPYKRSNWSAVERHVLLHLNGQGLVCPLCSHTTSSHRSMIRHMTIAHPTSQIISKFQPSPQLLSAQIIEQHQCPLCSYQSDRAEALNLHRRLEHDDEEFDIDSSSDEDENIITAPTKNPYECPICSPSSDTNHHSDLEQLTLHVIDNHHNQSCPFCSFIVNTTSSQTLSQHVKLHFNGLLIRPDPMVGVEQVKELLMLE